MGKHLSFWIGFFAASLIIVPVAVGVWGYASELALQWGFFLFGLLTGLILLLVVALFFRGYIVSRVLGRAETTLEDVAGSLARLSAALAQGDQQAIRQEAETLARTGAGYWAFSSFYRWVISTALGLLLAFGAFTGTVLLFEQTRVLGEQSETLKTQTTALQDQTTRLQEQTDIAALQSELMTLDLVARLRQQMLETVETRTLGEIMDDSAPPPGKPYIWYTNERGLRCGLTLNEGVELMTPPSQSTIQSIAALGKTTELKGRIEAALRILVLDDTDAVSLGARLVLDLLGHSEISVDPSVFINRGPSRRYTAIYAPRLAIKTRGKLSFRDSLVNVVCTECEVSLRGSIGGLDLRRFIELRERPGPYPTWIVSRYAYIQTGLSGVRVSEGTLADLPGPRPSGSPNIRRFGESFSTLNRQVYLEYSGANAENTCEEFRTFSSVSGLFGYIDLAPEQRVQPLPID